MLILREPDYRLPILTDGGRQEQQIFADLAENKHVLKRRSLKR